MVAVEGVIIVARVVRPAVQVVQTVALDAGLALPAAVPALVTNLDGLGHAEAVR